MKAKLIRLTLVGNRKNYSVPFHNGLNFISGHTSTGKTSILEMIDYALGSKGHKSYIEIGNSCSDVELEIMIGEGQYRIKRRLFDFKAPVIVEEWHNEKNKYLFYNRLEVDSPSNSNSLSVFLLEKLGLSNFTISGQAFSFRDLFKYSYLKQTAIDNEDILDEKEWAKDLKRKATFEIIFNIYDELLEDLKSSLVSKEDEAKELRIKLAGIKDFVANTDFSNVEKYNETFKQLTAEIVQNQKDLSDIKSNKGINTERSTILRNRIAEAKRQLETALRRKDDQQQYLNKLRLLLNQYQSEIDKNEMASEGYFAFNEYEYLVCPNCLKPLNINISVESCCLCGSERTEEKSELILLKKEVSSLKRKTNELIKFIEEEDIKYDSLLREYNNLQKSLSELEIELQHIYKDYVNPQLEQIELLNYEIGQKNRLLFELQQNLKMLEEIERYEQLMKTKDSSIKNLKDNIKKIKENATDKQQLLRALTDKFTAILAAFNYPKLSASYIDEKRYLPYVRTRKYDDIGSLAGVTLITMAYYLSILLEGSGDEYSHLNLLMIDSPRKNLGAQASQNEQEEFKDEKIFNSIIHYFVDISESHKDSIQLIVVSNGYPEFLPKKLIIAEFDSDGTGGLPRGLIDDAN